MRKAYVRPQQRTALNNFVNIIANAKDLKLGQKLSCLEYAADECLLQEDNLNYLEYKQAIKELHEAEDKG
jgi:hypothetical protein